jgi:hypothetical protein
MARLPVTALKRWLMCGLTSLLPFSFRHLLSRLFPLCYAEAAGFLFIYLLHSQKPLASGLEHRAKPRAFFNGCFS